MTKDIPLLSKDYKLKPVMTFLASNFSEKGVRKEWNALGLKSSASRIRVLRLSLVYRASPPFAIRPTKAQRG